MKHPLEYSAYEIDNLLVLKLKIGVGPIVSEKIVKYYDGFVLEQYLASNPSNLPASIDFKT